MLDEFLEIIEDHIEEDFECYRVGYQVSYKDGNILLKRIVTYPTGETSEWGYIDTNSYESVIVKREATLEEYANLPIFYIRHLDEYKIEFDYAVDRIDFKPIL